MEAKEDKKIAADGSEHITVHVLGQDEDLVYFRIRRNTPLKDLMRAYCEEKSVDVGTFVFLYKSRLLREGQTPAQVKLKDGSEIDAMKHQIGGAN